MCVKGGGGGRGGRQWTCEWTVLHQLSLCARARVFSSGGWGRGAGGIASRGQSNPQRQGRGLCVCVCVCVCVCCSTVQSHIHCGLTLQRLRDGSIGGRRTRGRGVGPSYTLVDVYTAATGCGRGLPNGRLAPSLFLSLFLCLSISPGARARTGRRAPCTPLDGGKRARARGGAGDLSWVRGAVG